MHQQILNYWYNQEFFNPCWPVNIHEDINLLKSTLPWKELQPNPKIRVSYDVYFGKAHSKDMIIWALDTLNIELEEDIERDNSLVCLCALKVDEEGKYVENSFIISSFVWAICKLVTAGSFCEPLQISDLEKLQQSINNGLLPNDEDIEAPRILEGTLHAIYSLVCDLVKVNQTLFTDTLWARKKIAYANKDGRFPPLDPSTELLQSFYLKDIGKLQKQPTARIQKYIEAMLESSRATQRIQIDTDVAQMQKWLKAKAFPLGAWPSPHSPSLMQQLGINIAVSSEQDIFSINGPPGTGKTTLLKEIIVSNIIRRAMVMASYDSPDKAFLKSALQNPPDQYNQSYYKIDAQLTAYGMIVASNNNAAVENISVELPKLIDKARTERFVDTDTKIDDTYFADIATKLLDQPAWGLISAKLGKKRNIKALKDCLWWAEDEITLKRYFDGAAPDWELSRQNFQTALQAVIDAQGTIEQAQMLQIQQDKVQEKHQTILSQLQEMQIVVDRQQKLLAEENDTLKTLEEHLDLQHKNTAVLLIRIGRFKRIFWKLFKKNPAVQEWQQVEKDIEETIIRIVRQRITCQAQAESVKSVQAECALFESALQQVEEELRKIAAVESKFGDNWANTAFWQDIDKNEKAQTACPWTYKTYDTLREELFYQGLMLNKAFVLSSNCVKQNLMRLFAMWDGKFVSMDCEAAYGSLLNTLLLVIPVISTTFASVQTFLDGVKPEELGILVIDEAGQATPQSALGAIWRTQKTIVVGDPLQVEPIVTIPKELQRRFADQDNIPPIYRLPELSVQMLADQLNPYGGIRKMHGEEIWLGCPLVVHRRCLNPMFQISNEVAYNGKMFLQTKAPGDAKKFLLQQSFWFDVKGAENGNKDHSVKEQIDFVVALFKQAIDTYGGLPEIYMITPFTSVEYALKRAVRPLIKELLPKLEEQVITDWLKENCGTIHTFQGKEASEVLLVLGCDGQTGRGAARWVGEKPNIINVAVSRAKYRLGVIGDYNLWKSIPNVQVACRYLSVQTGEM